MNPQGKDWKFLYNLCDIIKFNYSKGLNFDKSSIAYQYISQVNQPLLDRHILLEKDSFELPLIDFNLLKNVGWQLLTL